MRDEPRLHPTLRRYAQPPSLRLARYVAAGAACGFAGIALALGLLRLADARTTDEAHIDAVNAHAAFVQQAKDKLLAGYMVREYALTAFPAWVAANPDKACPSSIDELLPYATAGEQIDSWETMLRLRCRSGIAEVTSAGPDGVFDTGDDIGSPQR